MLFPQASVCSSVKWGSCSPARNVGCRVLLREAPEAQVRLTLSAAGSVFFFPTVSWEGAGGKEVTRTPVFKPHCQTRPEMGSCPLSSCSLCLPFPISPPWCPGGVSCCPLPPFPLLCPTLHGNISFQGQGCASGFPACPAGGRIGRKKVGAERLALPAPSWPQRVWQ